MSDFANPEETQYLAAVRSRLQQGATDLQIEAMLEDASISGHEAVCRLLLEHGADVHANGDYALRTAAGNGHKAVCRLLIEHGADVHAGDEIALRWASISGHEAVCRLLLEHGADVHANDGDALLKAADNGREDVCRLLLEHGADVHARDDGALRWASISGHEAVCRLLIEHGAGGEYALRHAVDCGDMPLIAVEYINDNPPENELRIPIAHAWMFVEPVIQQGTTIALQILIDAGLDVHAALSNKLTPLVMAVKRNEETPSHDMVEILMKAGSEPSEAIKIAAMAPKQDMALLRLLTAEY
jgi:ankyrin repeat protein